MDLNKLKIDIYKERFFIIALLIGLHNYFYPSPNYMLLLVSYTLSLVIYCFTYLEELVDGQRKMLNQKQIKMSKPLLTEYQRSRTELVEEQEVLNEQKKALEEQIKENEAKLRAAKLED